MVLFATLVSPSCKKDESKPFNSPSNANVKRLQLAPIWFDSFREVDKMVASGPHLFGEFVPRGPGRPIPRAIIGVQIAGGETVAKDRGWLLKASNTLSNVLIVDEGDRELTYRVRRLGEKGGAALPAPDNASWVFRAAVCGIDVDLCAVIRWSPRPGERVSVHGVERLGITVVHATSLKAEHQVVLEVADAHAGTPEIGGVLANPERQEIYILEHTASGHISVQAVDLVAGKASWKATLETGETTPSTALEMAISGDGRFAVVGSGEVRWQLFQVQRLAVLDLVSGKVLHNMLPPNDWRNGFFMPMPGRSNILFVRIGLFRWTAESPTVSFLGVSSIDPAVGMADDVFDPASGARTESERESARWRTPRRGVVQGNALLFPPGGGADEYLFDVTPGDQQERRAAAVASLLAE